MLRQLALLGCAFLAAACVSEFDSPTGQVSSGVQSQATTNPSRLPGRIYADRACAECHAVAAGQTRSPDPKAPTFEMIANTPGMTAMALNVWLHTSLHRNMPYVRVDSDQVEALSEYLYTLKQ